MSPTTTASKTASPTRHPSAAAAAVALAFHVLLLVLTLAPAAVARQETFSAYRYRPYAAAVPPPSRVLGYEMGERHTTFRDQEAALGAIRAAAPDRVRVVEYGRSVEGRPLRLYAVSAPENVRRLEEIQRASRRLADPRGLSSADAEELMKRTPAIVWINHCIHGDETASFESAMWLLYTLAASESPEIAAAMRDAVVVINPVFNPDGHERYVVYYNSVALGSPEEVSFEHSVPWAAWGRYNHYRFDMNRDKLAQSQPETRQETREYLNWYPQVFVDQHGQPEVYFFPPNALPANRHVDRARLSKWTDAFGRANGEAFDRYNWPYVTRETFDLFYPGYLDSFTSLLGAVGMTYETDGGGTLARRRGDNTISTLKDAAEHHLVSAIETIRTAAKNRESLLRDFHLYRKQALTSDPKDTFRRVVVVPGADPGRAAELAALLVSVGVEVGEVTEPFASDRAHAYLPATVKDAGKAQKRTFPRGSLVIDLAQPQGRLAKAILEPDAELEPEFVKEQQARRARNEKRGENERDEPYEFYDTTAWSLPYTHGVEAYWCEDAPAVRATPLTLATRENGRPWDHYVSLAAAGPAGVVGGDGAAVAYLFDYGRDAAALLALRLLQKDYRLAVATRPVRVGAREWPRGTIMARAARNPASFAADIGSLSRALGVRVEAVRSGYGEGGAGLGSDAFQDLRRPRVAVATGEGVGTTAYGAVWYALDRAGVTFTAVPVSRLRGRNLDRFNVLILPDGYGYKNGFGKEGSADLRAWVERGNALLGLANGGTWFADKDADLTTAKPVGKTEEGEEGEPSDAKADPATKPLSLPGAIFRARIDADHFLGWGFPGGDLPVYLSGDTFLKASTTGANVITFGKGPSRLSGFVWPENTEKLLAETAYLIDEPVGAGHAILYLDDPTFRALWPGARRLLLSGILFGPMRAPYFNPGE